MDRVKGAGLDPKKLVVFSKSMLDAGIIPEQKNNPKASKPKRAYIPKVEVEEEEYFASDRYFEDAYEASHTNDYFNDY